jgi:hypothetical protein
VRGVAIMISPQCLRLGGAGESKGNRFGQNKNRNNY